MAPKNHWITDPEYIDLMYFLIERTKDVESPMNIKGLAREYKEKSGCSQEFHCVIARIKSLRERVAVMNTIDTETKVKIIFALSVSIHEDFLKGLQKDADVEVDGKNRITLYRAKDGSLELVGDHSPFAKMREGWKQKKSGSQEDSIFKTLGPTKRSAVKVQNSYKKVKSEEITPNPGLGQPKLEEATPIKTELDDGYTPPMKFLETIQFLASILGIPSSTPLQARIEKKLRELSSNEKISNDEISLAMGLIVAKLINYPVSTLSENAKSVRLSHVLCYLKAAITHSKLEGLEVLMNSIEEIIEEPASDKNIPVEEVASVLQDTLNDVGIFN